MGGMQKWYKKNYKQASKAPDRPRREVGVAHHRVIIPRQEADRGQEEHPVAKLVPHRPPVAGAAVESPRLWVGRPFLPLVPSTGNNSMTKKTADTTVAALHSRLVWALETPNVVYSESHPFNVLQEEGDPTSHPKKLPQNHQNPPLTTAKTL